MKIGIFPNVEKNNIEFATRKLIELCQLYQVSYCVPESLRHGKIAELFPFGTLYIADNHIAENIELAISLGGDGTVINLAKKLATFHIPVCGINLGTLGFLNEIELDSLHTQFINLLQHDYFIEKRMMLSSYLEVPEGPIIPLPDALNDIVIGRSNLGKMVRIDLYVNGSFIQQYPADGVIVATPTGSTGYSLSSGGPVMSPSINCMLVTPICPHLMQNIPLVFGEEDRICFTAEHTQNNIKISVDGINEINFENNHRLIITKSKETALFLRIKQNYFYETLFTKLLGS